MTTPPFDRLFAHLAWADDRALEALRAAPYAPPDAVKLMAHVLGAERVWMARIGGETNPPPVWPDLDLAGCERLAADVHGRYARFAETLDDDALARVVRYKNSAGAEFATTVSDILLQVALHGSYHRGQIAALVRASGATPVNTDFITYARSAPPAVTAGGTAGATAGVAAASAPARHALADELCRAIRDHRLVRFTYDGGERVVEPHLLGVNQQGHTALSAWFVRGATASGGPGWRLYLLDKIASVALLDERFDAPRPEYNPDDTRMRWSILCRV